MAAAQAFYMPMRAGQRLCIHHLPSGPLRGAAVHVHAWAEEMNKSRRMAAWQSRALARSGIAVLQIDLLGCGDSSGDFADARWDAWIDDVEAAARWMQDRHGVSPWLWGQRSGCLLAAAAARRLGESARQLLFWQPVPNGKTHLHQFLRIRAAADMAVANAKETMARLRQDLESGRSVNVAGYEVAPALALGLERATLEPLAGGGRLVWLEVDSRAPAALLPPSLGAIDQWRQAGWQVDAQAVTGPSFWQTQEIEDAPALVDATLAQLAESVPA